MADEDFSKTFIGVRFVLLGFDFSTEEKIRLKLLDGGGVDVGQYGPNCTHVIVGRLVDSDPICSTARSDGKTLITGLWVDHSFDSGMPADPTSIIYRPLQDLNGIPGARSLIVCLTGYPRHDREDIMTMVGLMGAQFSKPLVANQATHLVCYKFEGEKYELAKKMKTIKLVNHLWLEDCLKAWELLPEADYDKSTYELEMMEAQAKDSEDEDEAMAGKQHGERVTNATQNWGFQVRSPKPEVPRKLLDTSISRGLLDVNTKQTPSARENDVKSYQIEQEESHSGCLAIPGSVDPGASGKIFRGLFTNPLGKSVPANVVDNRASTSKTDEKFPSSNTSPSARENDVKVYHIEQEESHNGFSAIPGSVDLGASGKLFRGSFTNPLGKSVRANVVDNIASTSKTDEKSTSSCTSKFCSITYRKTSMKASLPLDLDQPKSITGNHPPTDVNELDVGEGFNLCSGELDNDGTIYNSINTLKEILSYPESFQSVKLSAKRKVAATSSSSSKLQKTCNNAEFGAEGTFTANETEAPRPPSLIDGQIETTDYLSAGNNVHHLGVIAENQTSSAATPEIGLGDNKKALQKSFEKLKETSMDRKLLETVKLHLNGAEDAVNDAPDPQDRLEGINGSSPGTNMVEVEKSIAPAELDVHVKGGTNSRSKPLKRKLLAKKALSSRPNFGRGKASNQKGSIYMNNKPSQKSPANSCIIVKEIEDLQRFDDSGRIKEFSSTSNMDMNMNTEMMNLEFGNEFPKNTSLLDNETEAPEDKEENELDVTISKEIHGDVHLPNLVDSSKHTDDNPAGIKNPQINPGKDETELEAEVASHGEEVGLMSMGNCTDNKLVSAKARPLKKTKKKNDTQVIKEANYKEGRQQKVAKLKTSDKKTGENEEASPPEVDRSMKLAPENVEKSEADKENRPVHSRDQNVNGNMLHGGKVTPKYTKRSLDPGSVSVWQDAKLKAEPVWFILSGHRLQRKEFQQVIKRLNGRVCRDSHQWSYHATHFIVPDPIRRTEKFFAAAASGRWILKTDYLSSSNEAGKFLDEELYEWHKNGLNEDGAINLEAPRKWRLLRERTGHGAFYGMHIIIYGDFIVPPLDTLKRVVKSGDGTILATSPPYSRFLESGVDFAIVSPGMPRVDIWIQEFLRYEIPCVSADYLVEYVCKPGYSLDKHVQFNTHAWAEKSFLKLINSMNEIVEGFTPEEDQRLNNDDIQCTVCGSHERGEVMLICGDESGSLGCGIGTHIECCDPPLMEVPEEDWFCSKCIKKKDRKKTGFRKRAC